ncbi:formate dehydrogenase accessory protein [Variibacter gotjawalensis]|uniref:Sulfur carrier protein FdhD n=1 Tax=Variibacter gotjawalensis TaxID=1333996 RepID=A0A0S3PRJ4_9BRAD|nr:formate dehydrogenase accessory sulfurtransferase FdhD [Variibacter gotjawalensis]RZS50732.1 FdhD protein [Variibacter gotjawalensis]BAT58568.1 formate dehydrogenase accessory protein [Variibacter gotjawalensis]
MKPTCISHQTTWKRHVSRAGERAVPEEVAIALTYNGGSYAVMMATPQDLEDFAYGFSLTEGIISSATDIQTFELIEQDLGIELRLWLTNNAGSAYVERRRRLAGPTGCGLCGIESLEEAVRSPRRIDRSITFRATDIMRALDALAPAQIMNQQTRAMHAAAFCRLDGSLVTLREDVGRHNALDKLAGALARNATKAAEGFVVITSRVSVEMVQKAAAIGVPLIVAVSAPTALAVRMAEQAGITLACVARSDGFEVFSHSEGIEPATDSLVA